MVLQTYSLSGDRFGDRTGVLRNVALRAVACIAILLGAATALWPVVATAQTLDITPVSVPDSTLGAGYSVQLTAQGGVAPYRFRAIQGPMPPGLTVSSDGLISGTTYQVGTFPFVIEVASATQQLGARAYTLQVNPPAGLSLSPSALLQGMAGIRYRQPVAAFGGTAPYTLSLSGTLPVGMSFDPVAGFDGTPLESGTFPLTLTATDAAVASVARNYNLVIVPAFLELYTTIPDATIATPYSYVVGHNGGLGPFQHVVSSGRLPNGMSLGVADGLLSGTPTETGQFPFQITLTDSTLGTPATDTESYVMVVLDPAVQITPATLPSAVYRVPYSVTLGMTGSTGPYQFAIVNGELPPGLTLTPAGLLSGTPTNPFPAEFTIQGTYANGAVARRTVRMEIPTTAVVSSSPPSGVAGTPYAHTVQIVGGTPPYRVGFKVLGGQFGMQLVPGLNLPQGLAIAPTPDGNSEIVTSGQFTIAGTPTSTGDYPIYLQIVDSTAGAPATNPAALLLRILPASVAVSPSTLPAASIGLPYSHQLTAQGGVAPYRFALSVDSQLPAGLTLSEAGVLSGTPTVLRSYSFGVDVSDSSQPTRGTGTTLVTLDVGEPAVVAPSRTVMLLAGASATVELTEGASGGPFTAATVVSLAPANAGTATIVRSGSGATARFTLTFVPASSFAGIATVTYTLTNGTTTSAPAAIAFNVVPRPDPALDAEVRGLIDAQAMTARRFATAQIGNFQQRLERLHGADAGANGFQNGLTFAASRTCERAVGAMPGTPCIDAAAQAGARGIEPSPASGSNAPFGIWVAGTVRSGDRDARAGRSALDFETEGLSIGADRRFGRAFVLGAGVGYGHDRTWVGSDDTRADARAYTFAAYAGYRPAEVFFLDGLLGHQRLDYDLRRSVSATGGTVSGRRDGRQWFAAVTAGAQLGRDAWRFTPYGRVEGARGSLGGYVEGGDALYALRYDAQDLRTLTANLGLRMDYRVQWSSGVFSPQLRLEYQRDLERHGAATLHYADWLGGPQYRIVPQGYARDRLELGIGALFDLDDAWSLRFGYRSLLDGDRDHSLDLSIDHRF